MILSANLMTPGQLIRDLPEREEINKIFQLSKDARVEVSGIAGTVEIETVESGAAEVHIVRSAATRAGIAAVLLFIFTQVGLGPKLSLVGSIALCAFSMILYVPLGYVTDRYFWKRRMAKRAAA